MAEDPPDDDFLEQDVQRRVLRTPTCVSLPVESPPLSSRNLYLRPDIVPTTPDDTFDEKIDPSIRHLYTSESIAVEVRQVERNRLWLEEHVAPALLLVDAEHTERRHPGNGRLEGTEGKWWPQRFGSTSPGNRRMACAHRRSTLSSSSEWKSEVDGQTLQSHDVLASDTQPSLLISPPIAQVKLLQVKGRQKDLCVKNVSPTASTCEIPVTPKPSSPDMKSYRYSYKGDSKTPRETVVLPVKVFNFRDDKDVPSGRVRRSQTAPNAATITLFPEGT